MKRFILTVVFILVFATILSACGERDYTGNDGTGDSASGESLSNGSDGDIIPGTELEIKYTVHSDFTEVTGCENAFGDIEIPSVLGGKTVTKIAADAFMGATEMTSIKLPDTLAEIGDRAFLGCSSLSELVIPDSVLKIGNNAVYGCPALVKITLGAGLSTLGANSLAYNISLVSIEVSASNKSFAAVDGVLFNAAKDRLISYPAGRAAESYTIPAAVKNVADFAFAYAKNLKAVSMSSSVVSLGDNTFYSCGALENVEISSALTYIGANTFSKCAALKSIVIPEGVKTIGYAIDSQVFGGSFTDCTALTSITLPSSLTAIYAQSFDGCESLSTINYAGSSAQWSAVTVGEDNAPVGAAAVNYGK